MNAVDGGIVALFIFAGLLLIPAFLIEEVIPWIRKRRR